MLANLEFFLFIVRSDGFNQEVLASGSIVKTISSYVLKGWCSKENAMALREFLLKKLVRCVRGAVRGSLPRRAHHRLLFISPPVRSPSAQPWMYKITCNPS